MNDEFKIPFQTECVVSGALSFVLFLSQIAGIAPLKFERTHDGWCVRVSWPYCIYSYILFIVLIIWTVVYYFGKGDELTDDRASWGTYTDVMRIISAICQIVMIIVTFTMFHTGYSRMCCMIDCISQLTLINQKMNHYFTSFPTNNATLWIFVFVSLIFGYLTVFTDYGLYMYDIKLADKVGVLSCSLITIYFFTLMVHLYAIQFAMIVMLVVSTLQRVNNSLKIILHEIRNEATESESASSLFRYNISIDNDNQMDIVDIIPRYVTSVTDVVPYRGIGGSSNPDKIRYLAIIYCYLCDIVRRLNISDGGSLLAMLLFCFTYMITTPYCMFNILFKSGSEVAMGKCILSFVYFLFISTILATAMEPCYQTHNQLLLTRKLIDKLLRYTGPEAEAIKYELKLFKQHILLNPVSFRPYQLLRFNRTTLVAVVSAVVQNITLMMSL